MKNKTLMISLIALTIILSLGAAYFYPMQKSLISDFESCAAAGYPVAESYPRQCVANGKVFTEKISNSEKPWETNGLILMQNAENGKYACFGCGATQCIDPAPIMKLVKQTPERYCSPDFEVIESDENSKLRFCPNEWILNQQPCACEDNDPACSCLVDEYFIVDGERMELSDFDLPFIQDNCELERQTVY